MKSRARATRPPPSPPTRPQQCPGQIAIAAIDSDGSSCHSGNHESPPSSVLKRPPDAGAAYMICGLPGWIASAAHPAAHIARSDRRPNVLTANGHAWRQIRRQRADGLGLSRPPNRAPRPLGRGTAASPPSVRRCEISLVHERILVDRDGDRQLVRRSVRRCSCRGGPGDSGHRR